MDLNNENILLKSPSGNIYELKVDDEGILSTSLVFEGKVNGITFKDTLLTLKERESFKLEYEVTPSTAINKSVLFSSTNDLVATVDSEGNVNAVSDGSCEIKVITVDGGYSSICVLNVEKMAVPNPIEDNLLISFDFSNKFNSSDSIVYDLKGEVEAKIINATGVFKDNKGATLPANSYIEIPLNKYEKFANIDLSKGITFEYVATSINGINFRNESSTLRAYNTISQFPYMSNLGTAKSFTKDSYWLKDPKGIENNRSYPDALNSKDELNVLIIRIFPDGKIFYSINGWSHLENPTAPADFSSIAQNILTMSSLFLRRNSVGLNTTECTVNSFRIYSYAMSDEDSLKIYNDIKLAEPLYDVKISPKNVEMKVGENTILSVVASPNRYNNLITSKFDSGNYGYVDVNQKGYLTGLEEGETEIHVESVYNGRVFDNYVPVKISNSESNDYPVSSREIKGISINRKTDSMFVGESFPAVATTLPFDVFNDNIVVWETSNPKVCTVNFGVITAVGEGNCTITAFDSQKKFSESFSLSVVNQEEQLSLNEYVVDINNFRISNNGENSHDTTLGIQTALIYARENGFDKITFPEGRYLINPDAKAGKEIIYLPTNMVVDFSGSTIDIDENSKVFTGYSIFIFDKVKNTKLVNANIFGEADRYSLNFTTTHEACMSVLIKDAYRSGIEKCTVSKSVGFNIATHAQRINENETNRHPSKDNWEAGSIDESGVNDDSVLTGVFRSKTYLNVANLKETYQLGYTQGYFGYPHLRSRLYSIFFYDSQYNFIDAHMYNLQFYNYKTPSNVRYAKIVIYQNEKPVSHDTDFNAVAMLRSFTMPTLCYIRDCVIEDNKSTGVALTGGQGWIIEGNTFGRNKGRMPACDIDWEDGWETSVGDVCRNNVFNSPSGVIVSGVNNITLYENTFNQSHLHIWARTADWKVFNNLFNGKGNNRNLTLGSQSTSYFAKNTLIGVTWSAPTKQHSTADYSVIFSDNNNI